MPQSWRGASRMVISRSAGPMPSAPKRANSKRIRAFFVSTDLPANMTIPRMV